MFEHINIVAVVVSAILSVAVRHIWFSPLVCGTYWMREIGMTIQGELSQKRNAIIATCQGIASLSIFYFFVAQIVTVLEKQGVSMVLSTSALLVILISYSMNAVIWEKRTFVFFCINSAYLALILFGGVGIISFWPW